MLSSHALVCALGMLLVHLTCSINRMRKIDDDVASHYFRTALHTQTPLFESVACGGTFDNLHSGHKKLLTLAASCCSAQGVLTVGVTADKMLQHKVYAFTCICMYMYVSAHCLRWLAAVK